MRTGWEKGQGTAGRDCEQQLPHAYSDICAVGGDIEVNTTTNSTQVVATVGEDATVPISPAVIEEGNSFFSNVIRDRINTASISSNMYFGLDKKLNIPGAPSSIRATL